MSGINESDEVADRAPNTSIASSLPVMVWKWCGFQWGLRLPVISFPIGQAWQDSVHQFAKNLHLGEGLEKFVLPYINLVMLINII